MAIRCWLKVVILVETNHVLVNLKIGHGLLLFDELLWGPGRGDLPVWSNVLEEIIIDFVQHCFRCRSLEPNFGRVESNWDNKSVV